MRKYLYFMILGLVFMLTSQATAKANDLQLGMFVQSGFIKLPATQTEISGYPLGFGGMMHMKLNPWLRLGVLGAQMTLDYPVTGASDTVYHGSHFNLKYGGVTAEFYASYRKVEIGLGAFIGGAKAVNLHINEIVVPVASYQETNTLVYAPIATIQYSVSSGMDLFLMLDFTMGSSILSDTYLGGPKVHIGMKMDL